MITKILKNALGSLSMIMVLMLLFEGLVWLANAMCIMVLVSQVCVTASQQASRKPDLAIPLV
jgi:hypothetical protein